MTPFRLWPEGKTFEMRDAGGTTRYGVKLAPLEYYEAGERQKANAFLFDTNALESVSPNKKVSEVRLVKGRLALTLDNRLIVVNSIQKGVWAGYYVNLTGYKTFSDSEIDLIPVEVGKRQDEVDRIMIMLTSTFQKSHKLLEVLALELLE